MNRLRTEQLTHIAAPVILYSGRIYNSLHFASVRERFEHHKVILHALAVTIWVPWKGWDYSGTC